MPNYTRILKQIDPDYGKHTSGSTLNYSDDDINKAFGIQLSTPSYVQQNKAVAQEKPKKTEEIKESEEDRKDQYSDYTKNWVKSLDTRTAGLPDFVKKNKEAQGEVFEEIPERPIDQIAKISGWDKAENRKKAELTAKEKFDKVMAMRPAAEAGALSVQQYQELRDLEGDVDTFLSMTDPKYIQDKLDQWEETMAEQKAQEEQERISQPKDYYGSMSGSFYSPSLGMSFSYHDASDWLNSDHAHDWFSRVVLSANETQAETAQGKIDRADEFLNMSSASKQLLETLDRINDINHQLSLYEGIGIKDEKYNDLFIEKNRLEQLAYQLRDKAKALESWNPNGYEAPIYKAQSMIGGALQSIVNLFSEDAGDRFRSSYRDMEDAFLKLPNVYGEGNWVDDLIENTIQNKSGNYLRKTYDDNKKKISKLSQYMDDFTNELHKNQEQWMKEYQGDLEDIRNWYDKGASVSDYFKQQENLANEGGMSLMNPNTLLFGYASLIGASNSSIYKSIISNGTILAAIAAEAFSSGTATPALVAAIGAPLNFLINESSSSDENNSETHGGTREIFQNSLYDSDLYDGFFIEGLTKLRKQNDPDLAALEAKYNKQQDALRKQMFSNTVEDVSESGIRPVSTVKEQDIKEMVLQKYMSHVWKTDNPDVLQKHAGAVIGANSFYQSDHMATFGDNALDAVLFFIPTRYLMKGGRFVLGKGLQAGEKVGGRIASSQIGQKTSALYNKASEKISDIIPSMQLVPDAVKLKTAKFIVDHGLQVSAVARPIADGVTRGVINVLAEQTEETTQNKNLKRFREGGFSEYDSNFVARIFEDFMAGAPVTMDYWMGGKLNGESNDVEMQQGLNGAILLSLPMSSVRNISTMYGDAKRNLSIADVVNYNMQLFKEQQRSSIEQAVRFVEKSGARDIPEMKRALERYRTYNKKLSDVQNDSEDLDNESAAIPDEWIEQHISDYERIVSQARNPRNIMNAVLNGILSDKDSSVEKAIKNKDYQKFIAMLDLMQQDLFENRKNYKDKKEAINQWLSQYELTPEEQYKYQVAALNLEKDQQEAVDEFGLDVEESETNQDLRGKSLFEADKLLSRMHALFELIEDYTKVNPDGTQVRLANKMLKKLQKEVKDKYGFTINSTEDIFNHVINYKVNSELREHFRELLNYELSDQLLQSRLDQFKSNPQKHIDEYDKSVDYDKKLMIALEKSYNERMQELEDANNYQPTEGDVFTDGERLWAVERQTKRLKGRNGSYTGQVASEWMQVPVEMDGEETDAEPKRLDRLAYYRYKQDEKEEKEEAEKKAVTTAASAIEGITKKPYVKPTSESKPKPEVEEEPDTRIYDTDIPLLPATSDEVEVEYHRKPWRNDKSKSNRTARIYLKGKKEKGYFEIVVDTDKNGKKEDGHYSLHFKPTDDKNPHAFTDEEKKILFDTMDEMLPVGAKVSTWTTKENGITKGGIHGLERFGKGGYGYKKVQVRKGWTKDGEEIMLPIYRKDAPATIRQDSTEPNAKQKEVLAILQDKLEKDQKTVTWNKAKSVVRTGHDYFIKQGRSILRFLRVHGVLSEFNKNKIKNEELVDDLADELLQLQSLGDDHKKYKERVNELAKKRDEALRKQYHIDENPTFEEQIAYDYQKEFDLSPYMNGESVLSDKTVPKVIAQLYYHDIVVDEDTGEIRSVLHPSVFAGNIVDEICRAFFAGEPVVYKKEYMMNQNTFDSLIDRLEEHQRFFNKEKWVVTTDKFIWHCTLPNGQKVSGETDMLAIDESGQIHIIDFKTTKLSLKKKLEYKSIDDTLEGDHEISSEEEEWIAITDDVVVPEGAEIREGESEYVTSSYKGSLTQAQQHAQQLSLYALMIKTELANNGHSVNIADIRTLVVQIVRDEDKDNALLNKIDQVVDSDLVNLTELDEVQSQINSINKEFNEKQEIMSIDEVSGMIDTINKRIQDLKDVTKVKVKEDVFIELNKLYKDAEDLVKELNELRKKKNKKRLEDQDTISRLRAEANRVLNKADELDRTIVEQQAEGSRFSGRRTLRGQANKEGRNQRGSRQEVDPYEPENEDEELEEVTEDDQNNWEKHNNIQCHKYLTASVQSFIDRIKSFFLWKKNTGAIATQSDLLENGIFNIFARTINGKQRLCVTITYKGKQYGKSGQGFLINEGIDEGQPSVLARNLRRQFAKLSANLKAGQKIVATKVRRTNGTMVIGKNRSMFGNATLLGNNNELLWKLFSGNIADHLLGFVDKDGRRVNTMVQNSSEEYPTIYEFTGKDSEELADEDGNIIGSTQASEPGTIIFLHKFRYNEDAEEDGDRVVPLALKPKALSKNEIDFIIDILANNKLQDDVEVTITRESGKKEKVKMQGVTNEQIVRMLIRYTNGPVKNADGTMPRFHFYPLTKNNPNHTKYKITDPSQGFKEVVVDLSKPKGIADLTTILANVDRHVNDSSRLRHNINSDEDSFTGNPYLKIKDMFVGEFDDVLNVEITDNIQFEYSDVYGQNGESKGMSGAAWMIKHGLLETNFIGLQDPLISIQELGVADTEEGEQYETESSKKGEKKSGAKRTIRHKAEDKPEEEREEEPTEGKRTLRRRSTDKKEEKPEGEGSGRKIRKAPIKFRRESLDVDDDEPVVSETKEEDEKPNRNEQRKNAVKRALRIVGRKKEMSKKDIGNNKVNRSLVEKRLRRIFGNNFQVQWFEGIIEDYGDTGLVGAMMSDIFLLSDIMPGGVEYHEAFHRVMELLLPTSVKLHLEQRYRNYFNDQNISEHDVSENMADMYMIFRNNLDQINYENDIKLTNSVRRAISHISNYINALRNVQDWQLAALYVAMDTGAIRMLRPSSKRISRLQQVYGGVRKFSLQNPETKEFVEFTQFNNATGRRILNEIMDCIMYALFSNQGIDVLGRNVRKLDTSKQAIKNLYKNKKPGEYDEKNQMSQWYRVMTGQYINEGIEFTKDDASFYIEHATHETYEMYVNMLLDYFDENDINPDELTDEEYYDWLASIIYENESKKTKLEELEPVQRMMNQAMEEFQTTQGVLIKRIERLHLNSKERREKNQEETRDGNDLNPIAGDVNDHSDKIWDHSRMEDMDEIVAHFLSRFVDGHFTTDEDVENGLSNDSQVDTDENSENFGYHINAHGKRSITANKSSLVGMIKYMPLKDVSTKLLTYLYDVKDVKEMLERIKQLGNEDVFFYKLYDRLMHEYKNTLRRYPDGDLIVYVKDGNKVKLLAQGTYRIKNNNGDMVVVDLNDNVIKNAEFLINNDAETLVTKIFQYVSTQNLKFDQVYMEQMQDENTGKKLFNRFIHTLRGTDIDFPSRMFPIQWFSAFKSSATGIFKISNGKYQLTRKGKRRLEDAYNVIHDISNQLSGTRKTITINGTDYNRNNTQDVKKIMNEFVSALNTIGIHVTMDEFKFFLNHQFGKPKVIEKDITYLEKLCRTRSTTISLDKFVTTLKNLKNDVNAGRYDVLDDINQNGKTTGSKIFADNAFVKSLAADKYRYNKLLKELCVTGPENTKRFTKVQRNTASDVTSDLNGGVIKISTRQVKNEETGQSEWKYDIDIAGSRILKEICSSIYTMFVTLDRRGNSKIHGSLIAKHFAQNDAPELELVQHGGTRTEDSRDGGKDYTDMSTHEDLIAKIKILVENGLIFPTLSDKATYFFLRGLKLAGLNYQSLRGTQLSILPIVTHADLFDIDYSADNAAIDQLIEYAYCEHKMIRENLDRMNGQDSRLKKIKNYFTGTKNAVHYGFMRQIYHFDKNGQCKKFTPLDNIDADPEETWKRAEKEFFGENVSQEDRRKSIMYALQQETSEMLKGLTQSGIIRHSGTDMFAGYTNVGLDYNIISRMKDLYLDKLTKLSNDKNLDDDYRNELKKLIKKDKRSGQVSKDCDKYLESLAIVAFAQDIVAKSIQCEEETSRFYTGFPQFFKWIYSKNPITVTIPGTKKIKAKYRAIVDRYSDQSKRHGGLGSTGDANRLDLYGVPQEYTCADITDPKMISDQYEIMRQAFEDSEFRQAYYFQYKDGLSYQEQCDLSDRVYGKNGQEKMSLDKIKEGLDERDVNLIQQVVDDKLTSYGYQEDGKWTSDFGVADGAAFISPKMTEYILRQRGDFNGKVALAFAILDGSVSSKKEMYAELYNKFDKLAKEAKKAGNVKDQDRYEKEAKFYKSQMKSHKYEGDFMSNSEAYKIVTEALLSPEKYSAYGYRMEDGVPVHYYDKFALFPLFPAMATGFSKNVLDKMVNHEGGEIHMLMFDDAIKVGGCDAKSFNKEQFDAIEDEQERQKALDDFKFTTYKQRFVNIRRQMNTDPHEKRTRSVGTQVAKVALSAIDAAHAYVTRSGEKIRGVQLADRVMESINELANIGERRVRAKFFTDGKFDFEKLGKFLYEQLDNREADNNLLDGLKIITDPKTGEKRFDIPIDATSSSSWMESIISSIINKEIIEIQTPGNAYYQRSVFGQEGFSLTAVHDKNERVLYNGKKLKAINEDGSMDALISIDYFYNMGIIPKEIGQNFDKARQWLIDNNFIGENATATTIGYRIPTQAQSSVHPLRFVDVTSVMRSTVVLPKDFTAITGSDFDIDKLYLFTANFNAEGKPDYQLIDDPKTEADYKNNERYWQNRLIFDYITALKTSGYIDENGKYVGDTAFSYNYGSVDKDTQLLQRFLKRAIDGAKPVERFGPFRSGNLIYQVRTKAAFLAGKVGIGPFALNNNSQILTQIFGVGFKKESKDGHKTILEMCHASSLANKRDKRGKLVLGWLSGLINAHVDVAKDPWITRLGVNKFTWNLVSLMVRTGFADGTFAFTAQPIIKAMAEIAEANDGEYLNDLSTSASQRTEQEIKEYVKEMFIESDKGDSAINQKDWNTDLNMSPESQERIGNIFRQLMSIDDDGKYTNTFLRCDANGNPYEDAVAPDGKENEYSILYDVLMNEDARKDKNGDVTMDNMSDEKMYVIYDLDGSQMTLSPKEVQAYVYKAYRYLTPYTEAISELVNTSKIDTKKQGNNLIEQQIYKKKFDRFVEKAQNDESLFEKDGILAMYTGESSREDIPHHSFIGHKTNMAINLFSEIMNGFSIKADPVFLETHQKVITRIGAYDQNEKISRKVQDAILQYLKSSFFYGNRFGFTGYLKQHNINPKMLLVGDKTTQDKLVFIQNAIMADRDGEYSRYGSDGQITNVLLKALNSDAYSKPEDEHDYYKFITLENSFLDDRDDVNDIEEAWEQMLADDSTTFEVDDEYSFTMKDFAEELAVYAFITSGDKSGQSKFFKYVPNTWRKSSGYSQYMYDLRQRMNPDVADSRTLLEELLSEDAIEEIIRNNWQDSDFVKQFELESVARYRSGSIKTDEDGRPIIVKKSQVFKGVKDMFQYSTKILKRFFDKKAGYAKTVAHKADLNAPYAFAATYSFVKDGKTVTIPSIKKNKGTDTEPGSYPMFVRVERPGAGFRDHNRFLLYKFVFEAEEELADGKKLNYPIYVLTQPKGKRYRAGTYSYDIIQYGDSTQYEQAYTYKPSRSKADFNAELASITEQAINELIRYVSLMSGVSDDITEATIEEAKSESGIDNDISMAVALEIVFDSGALDSDQYNRMKSLLKLDSAENKKGSDQKKYPKLKNVAISHGNNPGLDKYVHKLASKYGVETDVQTELKFNIRNMKKLLNKVAKNIGRTVTAAVERNAAIVDSSDQVICISPMDKNGYLKGHSGWAAELAIEQGKPLFIYDTNEDQWYKFDTSDTTEGEYVKTETPVLTKSTAFVSSESENDKLKKVVNDIFEATAQEQGAVVEDDVEDNDYDTEAEEACVGGRTLRKKK